MHVFLSEELKVEGYSEKVHVDRAHRVGMLRANKVRPIVVKFRDTTSKMIVKDTLRNVNLRSSPYNVSEQYPQEVQQKRMGTRTNHDSGT